MSHQTGIKGNTTLLNVFGKSKDGRYRLIKISIVNEELTVGGTCDPRKDWERDYDRLILPIIEEDVPCYILYRLDSRMQLGYAWLLISWTPDTSSIRQKMLYASTKATLKTEFGAAHIVEEYHATAKDEMTLAGYLRHKKAFSAPAPLTMREEEIQEIRRTEVNTDISTDSRHQTLGGMNFPMTQSAARAIRDMTNGDFNYIQFRIDLKEETIHLVKASNIDLLRIPNEIPSDQARYHIYLFKHTHEGDYMESFVFIYSMPGYNCSVKERMMYSSCKRPFLEEIGSLGLPIAKNLEIDNGSELTEEYLQDELHPKKILHRPQFSKPKGPPNRGAKRLTRPDNYE